MSEPTLLILDSRKRGRPRETEPRAKVQGWILADQRKALVEIASAQNVSVSGLIRALVLREVERRRG